MRGGEHIKIPWMYPAAASMLKRAQSTTCPSGIITHTAAVGKCTKTRWFYGNLYTVPTPHEETTHQLGLVLAKPYILHLHNTGQRMDAYTHTPKDINTRTVPGLMPHMAVANSLDIVIART